MTNSSNQKSVRAYLIEMIMFLTYALFAVSWIAGSTLTPQIMESFDIKTFANATLITNAITIAKIVGNLMAAWVLIKLKPKKAIALGSLLISLSALGAFATSYWLFVLTRFMMGIGGALFIVYFGPIVFHYFTAKQRPMINGINSVAYNVGSLIAMVVVTPVILALDSWQNTILVFAGTSFLLFVAWLLLGEDFEIYQNKQQVADIGQRYTFREGLKDKFNYICAFTYSGCLLLYLVILTIFPLSQTNAMDAKTLTAVMAIAGCVGTVFGIMAVKKFALRLPVIRWSGLAMTVSALLMVTTSSPVFSIIAAFLLGFFTFLPMTTLVTIPQELPGMTPSKVTVMMGFFWSFAYIIETILYYLVGLTIDMGGFQSGIYLAIGFSLTFFIGSFLLPETGKRRTAVDTAHVQPSA
ncbi:MFS transporter [Paenibacillus arenosi]|uniref:MFS transporter n=1 Tax=Paenibacillus arenosi TaxID=2774142 RepID=A0ABR9AVR2_9BACL|nr:MFS transporter [Paenibacillus arenosi]MBD8497798.1 MFS transporter [Paenibacillus arenosi]